jgi:hypothetical protein
MQVQARIQDGLACSDCHTMHNSQNGISMGLSEAQGYLLVNDCIGCHQGNVGSLLSVNSAPIVLHTSEPNTNNTASSANNTLAGGSFYWVSSTGGALDNMGHNVEGLAAVDITNSTNPPGGPAITSQLTCYATIGCHTATAVHHSGVGGDSSAPTTAVWVDGSSPAASYRFLNGIQGGENGDWEYTNSSTDHNVYWGSSGVGTTGSSPWVRHPTDISLNTIGGEFSDYNTYDPIVPVAINAGTSAAIGGPNSQFDTIQAGRDNVTCISCHRAHGSGFDDLLRWNYRAWPGSGSSTGCPTCHTSKN